MVPIRQQELQLKTKAEIPTHCDTQVRKTQESIKISNKKFKARNIASRLSKWKEITFDKWVLITVSGANIEFEEITRIPLAQRKLQNMKEIQIFLDKKQKIYLKKVQLSQLQIMNECTFPQSF